MKSSTPSPMPLTSSAGPRKRGRPRSLWQEDQAQTPCGKPPVTSNQPQAPIYGGNKVIIQYRVRDLLWRPARPELVRFVAGDPSHEKVPALLACAEHTSLDAIDIIRPLRRPALQDQRHTFKQAVRQIGSLYPTISGCPT